MLDLRVVELVGRDIWGAAAVAHCGRVLADLGAAVIRAEPTEGDRVRRIPPFASRRENADRGLMWIALNANKRSVVLTDDDIALRDALVREADVVIQPSLVIDPRLADPRLIVV